MKHLILGFALLWPAMAYAERTPVVPIKVRDCGTGTSCMVSLGSGVVIGKIGGDLVVITAGHVVRDGGGKALVNLDGWREAKVIESKCEDGVDYAILTLPFANDWDAFELASDLPGDGERGAAWGYARGGPIKGVWATAWHPSGTGLWWTGAPIEGMSGGPVIYRGRVVATISGRTSDGLGYGSTCITIRSRIKARYGRMPIAAKGPYNPEPTPPLTTSPPVVSPVRPIRPPVPSVGQPDIDAVKARLATLEARNAQVTPTDIASLWAALGKVQPQPITVELQSSDGSVKKRTFQPGEPIRIKLPERSGNASSQP